MLEILLVAQSVGLLIGVPLLTLYWRERVKNVAREATEKALADYKHSHDQELANINASYQRQLHDFGLFAERRNRVYAKTYSLLEIARSGYARRFGVLTQTQNFSKSPEVDLRHLARTLTAISEGERANLNGALDEGRLEAARVIANELHVRDSLRGANRAFDEFKSAWILHALFYSPKVSEILGRASWNLGYLSIFAQDLVEEGDAEVTREERKHRRKLVEDLEVMASELRAIMRAEMNPTSEVSAPSDRSLTPGNAPAGAALPANRDR